MKLRALASSPVLALLLATGAAGLTACGKSDDKASPEAANPKIAQTGGKLKVKFKQSKTASLGLADSAGVNTGAGIETLAYVLDRIELFREGSLDDSGTGTGYTIKTPGWTLFNRKAGNDLDYSAFDAEAAKNARDKFTNFLDPAAVEAITQNVTFNSTHVGKYTMASVNWYRPFYVKCSVELGDGTMLHTKAVKSFLKEGTGLNTYVKTLVDDMGTGPAEETVAMLPNGGTFSSFGKPFEITEGDVTNKTEFKLVMAYRPEGLCQGYSANSATNGIKWANHPNAATQFGLDSVPTMQMKFLDVIPIVARKGEKVIRESYKLSIKTAVDAQGANIKDDNTNGFTSDRRILMDVYRVGADDVRGVTFTALSPEGGSGANLMAPYKPVSVSFEGGKISALDWTKTKVIDGFTPSTTVGQKADLSHEACLEHDMATKSCKKVASVVFETELVETTTLDEK